MLRFIFATLLFATSLSYGQQNVKIFFDPDQSTYFVDSTAAKVFFYTKKSVTEYNTYTKSNSISISKTLDFDSLSIIVDASFYSKFIAKKSLLDMDNISIPLTKSLAIDTVDIHLNNRFKVEKSFIIDYYIRPLSTNKPKILSSFLEELPEIDLGSSAATAYGGTAITYLLNSNKIDREVVLALPLNTILKVEIVNNPSLYNIIEEGIVINVITKEIATIGSSNALSANFLNTMYGITAMPYYMKGKTLATINFNTYRNYSQSDSRKIWDLSASELTQREQSGFSNAYVQPLFFTFFLQQEFNDNIKSSLTVSYNQKKINIESNLSTTDIFTNSQRLLEEDIRQEIADNVLRITNENVINIDKHSLYLNTYYTRSGFNMQYNNTFAENNVAGQSSISNQNTDHVLGIQASSFFKYSEDVNHVIIAGFSNRNIRSTNFVGANEDQRNIQNYYANIGLNFSLFNIATYAGAYVSQQYDHYDNELNQDGNISPRISFSKKFEKAGNVSLNISRSIFIPDQSYLSAFFYEDNLTEQKYIDSTLLREYKTSVNLQHSKTLFEKSLKIRYVTSLFYNLTRNALGYNGYQFDESNDAFTSRYMNIGDSRSIGGYISLAKNFDSFGSFRTSYQLRKTDYNLVDFDMPSIWSHTTNSSFSVNLPKKISVDLSCYYTSRNAEAYIVRREKPRLNFSIYKEFLDGRLNASLDWNNIFNINDNNRENYMASNVYYEEFSIQRPQTIGFGLVFLIGKELNKSARSEMFISTDQVKGR